MTVLVINRGIIKSITMLTVVILPIIKFDVDTLRDCFQQEVKWRMAIRYQLSTLSALDLSSIYHLPYPLLQEKDTYCLPEANESIPNALRLIPRGGDHKALLCPPLLIESNGI